ncbi:HNH endonuclease signature motif containing protein [Terribacillus sp. 7520-G]|uniref:HNH endonuclease signature motif containing protein n=1 Tax=Terribacillus sp. 7520-G TaxID=2025389 RepID=UPI000BA606B1|nr:HNH endonuclease signature motif containing protein [Terribacillus sp. 7520-G]PAD39853.1 hypothetical protein CHH53_03960 [Terribacillus sp. 7520-G]
MRLLRLQLASDCLALSLRIFIIKPKKRCNKASCRQLIDFDQTFCDKHKGHTNKQYNYERYRNEPTYIAFYNSSAWRKLRRQKLIDQPLCERCLRKGFVTSATIVHHIIETKVDWDKRLDWENLESVCFACHNRVDHKS